jgi:hypothetical protein|eukprot:evm.model.NODE_11016_length_15147_cov_34.876411.3
MSAETAANEKADRMEAYLEEKYERLRRDKEEEKDRRANLEETMVRKGGGREGLRIKGLHVPSQPDIGIS